MLFEISPSIFTRTTVEEHIEYMGPVHVRCNGSNGGMGRHTYEWDILCDRLTVRWEEEWMSHRADASSSGNFLLHSKKHQLRYNPNVSQLRQLSYDPGSRLATERARAWWPCTAKRTGFQLSPVRGIVEPYFYQVSHSTSRRQFRPLLATTT